MIEPQHLKDQLQVDLRELLERQHALPYRGPHHRDHLRSVRVFGRQYLWADPGTGVLRLEPDPEGQAKLERARAAVSRVWQPGL